MKDYLLPAWFVAFALFLALITHQLTKIITLLEAMAK